MENVNPTTKRIVGGSSFTDSIIRTNANTEQYVKYVLSQINKIVINDSVVLEYACNVFSVSIMFNGERVFSISNEDIEKFRQSEVLAFDKFIINMLKFAKYDVNETSDYYIRVEKVNF